MYGPRCEKTCLPGFSNNKGTEQTAHPQSDQDLYYLKIVYYFYGMLGISITAKVFTFGCHSNLIKAWNSNRHHIITKGHLELMTQVSCI